MASLTKLSGSLHHNRFYHISSRSFSSPISNYEPKSQLPYDKLINNLKIVKNEIKRPLTLAEKVVYSHLDEPQLASTITRGETYLKLRPDRVAMQDASAQAAVLQFMLSGLPKSTVPATIHCDHYIRANQGAAADVAAANEENKEVTSINKKHSQITTNIHKHTKGVQFPIIISKEIWDWILEGRKWYNSSNNP